MKVDLSVLDGSESFMVHPHQVAGETVMLCQPTFIGAKMVVESWPVCKATIERTQKFVTARRSTSNYDKVEFVTI